MYYHEFLFFGAVELSITYILGYNFQSYMLVLIRKKVCYTTLTHLTKTSRAGIKSWRTMLYIKKKKRSPFRGLWQDEFFVDSLLLLLCFSLIVVVQALKCQEK